MIHELKFSLKSNVRLNYLSLKCHLKLGRFEVDFGLKSKI